LKQAIKPGNIIVIGSSAGGPRILKSIFTGLPKLDAGVVVVQHMPKFINESLRDSLSSVTSMTAHRRDNAPIERDGFISLPARCTPPSWITGSFACFRARR
jgi:two-component system chemotaxis response regulator CheB